MAKQKLVVTETEEERKERIERREPRTFNLEPQIINYFDNVEQIEGIDVDDLFNVMAFQYVWITSQLMMGNMFYLKAKDENGKETIKPVSLLEQQITRKAPE
jgi:hypothetical protein